MPQHYYQAKTIRDIELLAMRILSISEYELMQRAARSAFNVLMDQWRNTRRVAVVCGSGNNGGDGYELAAHALKLGLQAEVWAISDAKTNTAQSARQAYLNAGGEVRVWNHELFMARHRDGHAVLVDALLGTGLQQAPREGYAQAIDTINAMQATGTPILALDVPSGIHADTGHAPGASVNASLTVSFVGKKPGLVTGAGVVKSGRVIVDHLGIPATLYTSFSRMANALEASTLRQWLVPLPADAHKGMMGKLQIVGGCVGMQGAVQLAGEAAGRIGAGWIQLVTHHRHAASLSASLPALLMQAILDTPEIEFDSVSANAVLLGCGLGQSDWGAKCAAQTLDYAISRQVPMVVDADGLNILARQPRCYERWILTPHPKEAARLLHCSVDTVQTDRYAAAHGIAERYGGVCVLKGAGTWIVSTDQTGQEDNYLNTTGNPGLASAGTGDVLAGMIAGLLAQGLPLQGAAAAGVWLHGRAADHYACNQAQRSMMAMDLSPQLGYILRQFEQVNTV